MKKFITSLCLLLSVNSLAASMSQSEANYLATEFQFHSSEEVGAVISAECVEDDAVTYKCQFEYELPVDYCWYGSFKSNVSYVFDNHGALEIVESKTTWQE
jgi:hypothetical protein